MDADERDLRRVANEKSLKAAVTALFRLLKHPKGTAVLGPVLQALGRFVHLIDVEVAADVLAALEAITERATLPMVQQATDGGDVAGSSYNDEDAVGSSKASDAYGSRSVAAFTAGASSAMQDDRSGAVLNEDELAVLKEGAAPAWRRKLRRGSKAQKLRRRLHVLLNEQPLGRLPIPVELDPVVAFELVSAAAWILGGPGLTLGFDNAAFTTFLYRAMLIAPMGGLNAVGSACRSVSLQLLKRREQDSQVAAAFAKRCLVVSMQVDSAGQGALIQLFRQIVGSYSEVEQILDRVQDRV